MCESQPQNYWLSAKLTKKGRAGNYEEVKLMKLRSKEGKLVITNVESVEVSGEYFVLLLRKAIASDCNRVKNVACKNVI